ncbi:MAG TPA: HIT family protein [bacterium]|nr:HIT family protein [bacterium]
MKKSQRNIAITHDPYSEECQKNARKSILYSQIASSVTKCPFCDLKEKYVISQTEDVVLTVNLFPYIDGHLMVIPKKHIEKMEDFLKKDWQDCRELISLGIATLKEGLQVQDVNVLYREGTKNSGSSLKHLHIHLLPIKKGFMKGDTPGFGYKYQDLDFSPLEMAEKLRQVCWNIQNKCKE